MTPNDVVAEIQDIIRRLIEAGLSNQQNYPSINRVGIRTDIGISGAPEIASCAKEVVLVLKQSARTFVKKLDFLTSVGYLDGGDSRKKLGLPGKGPVAVVTDLCVMTPDEVTKELTATQLHPGVTREQVQKATAWEIQFAADLKESIAPTEAELRVLRDLLHRTAVAHGQAPAA